MSIQSNATVPVRGFVTLGAVAIAVLLAGSVIFAFGVQIAGAVIAHGEIAAAAGHRVVQHPDGGAVEVVLVRDGDAVQAGDVVARIDGTDLRLELAETISRLLEIAARESRLVAERDGLTVLHPQPVPSHGDLPTNGAAKAMGGQIELFMARQGSRRNQLQQLQARSAQIDNQTAGAKAQLAALKDQLAIVTKELSSQTALLDKGLAPATKAQALKREIVRLKGAVGTVEATMAELVNRMSELTQVRAGLDFANRESAVAELRDLDLARRDLRSRQEMLRTRIDRLEILAPVSGIVFGLTVLGPGAVLRPADRVLTLVPQDGGLSVEAVIAPMDVDQIRSGQSVLVRLSALDAKSAPELTGRLTQISADALTDQAEHRRHYIATILLDADEVARLPQTATLRPGMPVEAFIQTGKRSLLSSLARPFHDYLGRALRDG